MKKIGATTYKETAFGIIPRSKLIPLEIEGIKRAWDFVIGQTNKKQININDKFIQKVHQIGFSWIFPELGGKFRTIDVQVSKHVPPIELKVETTAGRKKYIQVLQQADNGNYTGLEKLISSAIKESINKI